MQARLEHAAQCLLVIICATPEGKKELVGLIDGVRESAQSWRELLLDLKRRGLAMPPELAVADGALGFWQAIEEMWPATRGQRCWVHKTANVLNKLPKSQLPKAKRSEIDKSFLLRDLLFYTSTGDRVANSRSRGCQPGRAAVTVAPHWRHPCAASRDHAAAIG